MSAGLPTSEIMRAILVEPPDSRRTSTLGYMASKFFSMASKGTDREPAWKMISLPDGSAWTFPAETSSPRVRARAAKTFVKRKDISCSPWLVRVEICLEQHNTAKNDFVSIA